MDEFQRSFVVKKTAEFYTPAEIIDQFRTNWPHEKLTEDQVVALNPTVVIALPDDYALFQRVRGETLVELERRWPGVPETLQVVLLGHFRDWIAQRSRRAYAQANETAAEIAKILGGYYSGKTTGKDSYSGKTADDSPIAWRIVDPTEPVK